jgi:hypothetical protein
MEGDDVEMLFCNQLWQGLTMAVGLEYSTFAGSPGSQRQQLQGYLSFWSHEEMQDQMVRLLDSSSQYDVSKIGCREWMLGR